MLKKSSIYLLATYFIGASALSAGALGCDDNHFDQAPTVRAPAAPSSAGRAPAPQQGAPLAEGSAASPQAGIDVDLPADHPPLDPEQQPGQAAAQGAAAAPPSAGTMQPEEFGEVGPFRWEAPGNWLAVKPASAMRLAEYQMLGAEGTEPATLTVFYFGPQGGGEIQANIDRWVAQFKTLDQDAKQTSEEVAGMKVHRVEAGGTFDMAAAQGGEGLLDGWRMLGAIAESPSGNYFFKLTGPRDTVSKHEASFDEFVQSFRPADSSK